MRTARAWTFALLAVMIPASAVAAGIARFTLSVSPLVAGLFPMQVRAGRTAEHVARDLDPGKGDLRYRIRYEAADGSVGPASASVAVHRP